MNHQEREKRLCFGISNIETENILRSFLMKGGMTYGSGYGMKVGIVDGYGKERTISDEDFVQNEKIIRMLKNETIGISIEYQGKKKTMKMNDLRKNFDRNADSIFLSLVSDDETSIQEKTFEIIKNSLS